MAFQIGQYRFRGTGTCVTTVPSSKSYKPISMTGGASADDTSFRDIRINTSSPMIRDTDYYLYVKIPQDMNYNLAFNIKLTKQEAQGGTEEYQFLKNITIPRGGSATNTYNVVLYETSENEVKASPVELNNSLASPEDIFSSWYSIFRHNVDMDEKAGSILAIISYEFFCYF